MHRVGAVKMDMMDIMDIMDSWHMALWQPCAFEISQHMAHTAPCAPPPYTSVHLRTYPYCIAHSIGFAQCALPANRTHSPVLSKFQSAWLTLHQVPIVRQVRLVRPVRHSLLPPCALHNVLCQPTEHTAMCYRNSKAHGSHCTKCPSSVQVRTSPYKSVFPCPHPVPCTMCFSRLKKLQKKVEKNGFCSILSL